MPLLNRVIAKFGWRLSRTLPPVSPDIVAVQFPCVLSRLDIETHTPAEVEVILGQMQANAGSLAVDLLRDAIVAKGWQTKHESPTIQ